jgi:hypothetical protein
MKLNNAAAMLPSPSFATTNTTIAASGTPPSFNPTQHDANNNPPQIYPINRTPLRITYSTKHGSTFNISEHHSNFLKEMQKMAPELLVIPNDHSIMPYTDLTNIPTDETTFHKHFKVVFDNNGNTTKVDVYHTIYTNQPFIELKFQRSPLTNQFNSPLLSYINKNKISAIIDCFNQHKTTSVGFFMCLHPTFLQQQLFHSYLCTTVLPTVDINTTQFDPFFTNNDEDDANSTSTETASNLKLKANPNNKNAHRNTNNTTSSTIDRNLPQFEVCIGSVSHRDPATKPINAKVLEIRCAQHNAELFKELFSSVDISNFIKAAHFVPRGLIQLTNNPNAYRDIVHAQINFTENTKTFAITGLTVAAASHMITDANNDRYNIIHRLQLHQSIRAIYPTTTSVTDGKWLVLVKTDPGDSKTNHFQQATNFFDQTIKQLFNFIPEDNIFHSEDHPVPIRTQKHQNSKTYHNHSASPSTPRSSCSWNHRICS